MADDGGVANGLASEDMDNCTHCSVVLHVDLDCFYAAVEHVRLGIPREIPLAVQQWRGLIAVNYAARASGISRHESADQALKKCPGLQLVHVETIGEESGTIDVPDRRQTKVSLERYRQASALIFGIFRRFSDIFEKASIDEAYLDVTAKVEEMINHGCDWDQELQRLTENTEQQNPTMVVLDGPLVIFNSYDRRMLAGAIIADKMRTTVRNELGYTCSVGIASNKLLAKIASAKNKPDRQTLIPPRAVAGLMQTMPLKKMRLLGGKLGEEVTQKWGVSTAGEAQALSIATLVSSFGERMGNYVWHAVRGIQADKVQVKQLPKSMLAAKSFGPTKELSDIRRWICILAEELSVRMLRDFYQNHRHPHLLQLYYRSGGFRHAKDHSKSWPMPRGALSLMSTSSPTSQQALDAFGHDKESTKEPHQADDEGDLELHHDNESTIAVDLTKEEPIVTGTEQEQVLPDEDVSAEDLSEDHDHGEGLGLVVTENSKALGRVLENAAYNMFKRLDGTFPCTRLALAASNFQELGAPGTKSIQHFFSNAGVGSSNSTTLQNKSKSINRESSNVTQSDQNSNTRGASSPLQNPMKTTSRKSTTPEKPKGILKYMHHTVFAPGGDAKHEMGVTSENGTHQLSKEGPGEDETTTRGSHDGPLPNMPIRAGALTSPPPGDLSSVGPSSALYDRPHCVLNEKLHPQSNDGAGNQYGMCGHELRSQLSSGASIEIPQSCDLRLLGQNSQGHSADDVDLGKVDMKEQSRILANIRNSSDQANKSEKQLRSQGVHSSAKRRRQSNSSAGQQSIGKFFHTRTTSSKDGG